jgi:hypothetical protein
MSKRIAAAAVIAGLLLAAGVAEATIPDSGGAIHACYKTSNGDLRLVDPSGGGSCNSNETSVSWTQSAPQGPQGDQGPAGVQGSTGPQGPAGLMVDPKTMIVRGTATGDPVIGGFSKTLTCPQGTKILNGTWQWVAFIDPKPPQVAQSEPVGDDGWVFAVAAGPESKGMSMFLFIECAAAK